MTKIDNHTRTNIVNFARKQIDTPWHHQGRVAGVALDCLGLVLISYKSVGIELKSQDGYAKFPPTEILKKMLEEQFTKIHESKVKEGDLVLISILGAPIHFGIISQISSMNITHIIHAYQASPISKTVETIVNDTWRRRFVGFYTMR